MKNKLRMLYGDNFRDINYRAYIVKSGKTTRVYLDDRLVVKLESCYSIEAVTENCVMYRDKYNRDCIYTYKDRRFVKLEGNEMCVKQFYDGRYIVIVDTKCIEDGEEYDKSYIEIRSIDDSVLAVLDDELPQGFDYITENPTKEYKNGKFYVCALLFSNTIAYAYIDMNTYKFYEYRTL